MFTKIRKSFSFKHRGYQQRRRPRQNVQPYPSYHQRQPKYWFNKNIVRNTEQQKPLAPDFQIQVNELEHKIKFLNEKSTAGGVYEHINN